MVKFLVASFKKEDKSFSTFFYARSHQLSRVLWWLEQGGTSSPAPRPALRHPTPVYVHTSLAASFPDQKLCSIHHLPSFHTLLLRIKQAGLLHHHTATKSSLGLICKWDSFFIKISEVICAQYTLLTRSTLKHLRAELGIESMDFLQWKSLGCHNTVTLMPLEPSGSPSTFSIGLQALWGMFSGVIRSSAYCDFATHLGILHLFYLDVYLKFQFHILLYRFLFWENSHNF